MEKLTITNFLGIRHAEIEVRRINLWIGPQASGKSVIAKLLYFFKKEVGSAFQENVKHGHEKRQFNAALAAKFETIFPRLYWSNEDFQIHYSCNSLDIKIKGTKKTSGRIALSFSYSGWMTRLQSSLTKDYKVTWNSITGSGAYVFFQFFDDHIKKSKYSQHFEDQIFIPASRTFFANLQKNIFSFLASEINIDYFLKEFGSVYEWAKGFYSHFVIERLILNKEISGIMESIIAGRYVYDNEKDFIVSARKTNLANASSGQQESLPMLLVLSVMPFAFGKDKTRMGFFIEEPEAHLFPTSQQAFIALLALIVNETPHQFFLTTHSPYLLTALNNCILAHATYEAADEAGKEKVLGLMPKNQHVAFADVAAWTVTDKGTVESILDDELQIIGASVLDGVSQHFETITNGLLDIRYGGQE